MMTHDEIRHRREKRQERRRRREGEKRGRREGEPKENIVFSVCVCVCGRAGQLFTVLPSGPSVCLCVLTGLRRVFVGFFFSITLHFKTKKQKQSESSSSGPEAEQQARRAGASSPVLRGALQTQSPPMTGTENNKKKETKHFLCRVSRVCKETGNGVEPTAGPL